MTHTEESLMALVNDALNAAEKAEADHCSPMGSPSFRQSNADAREAEAALRLAIREVLAQMPPEMQGCTIRFKECDKGHGWLTATNWVQHDCQTCRAEKAEAECERLRELIAELDGHEGAEGWSEGMRERIDAALKEQP